jgi:signal transduction histidine kinase
MTIVRSIRHEVDEAVHAWQANVTHAVLIVLAILGLPPVVFGILAKPFELPWLLWVGVSVYGVLIAALLIPRRHYRWRATILLSSLYVLAVVQLAVNGLAGGGRIALFALPLTALVLLGAREGWFAASISTVLLAAFTLLAWNGMLAPWQNVRENSVNPEYRLLQVLLLLAALFPLMVLFTRFLALQMQTMLAERQARRELEDESAARRHLEGEVMRVGEEERRRLGSELHDGLCQHLTAALLHCTASENAMAARDIPEAGPASRLREMIEESLGMAYDVSKGLCPVGLNPDALVSALERLARQTRETSGLECAFRTEGALAIQDPQKSLHLFRIAQEAVTNAVKHAHGRLIQMELLSTADSLTLRIQDNGSGKRPDSDTNVGGMGVPLMKHRAESIGGTLTMEHPAGGGTIVICRVPWEAL